MEIVVSLPELYFKTAMSSPNISEPSSPQNHFAESNRRRHVSAPTSPTTSAAIYAAFRKTAAASRHSSVPFDWEEKPGTPKSTSFDENCNEFFNFSFDIETEGKSGSFAAADELFESGKIRPLKPPPRLCLMGEEGRKFPRSGGFFSPLQFGRNRRGGKDLDPFVLAMVEATRSRRDQCKEGGFFEKRGRGWKSRIKELLLFRSLSARLEGKKKDFCELGSLSSSSSCKSSDSAAERKILPPIRTFILRSVNSGVLFSRRRN